MDTYTCTYIKIFIKCEILKLSACFFPLSDGKKQVFEMMRGRDSNIQRNYSPSLTPLQVQLFSPLPTKLKSLIRLVKYWKKEKGQVRTIFLIFTYWTRTSLSSCPKVFISSCYPRKLLSCIVMIADIPSATQYCNLFFVLITICCLLCELHAEYEIDS